MNLLCHPSTFNLMIPHFLLMLALTNFRKGFLKVHLGPQRVSVIENNPNKDLIISMSIKQEFR
jgi:hypothetical protein